LCFLVLAAAAAGDRRLLLPREDRLQVWLPTTAEEAVRGEPLLADGEQAAAVRRMDLQTQDYPGSGANSRHDLRNPH
jgi:hypothetical protein